MNIYLDNCCFNRPYDDQTSIVISTETKCKLHVQEMIRKKKFTLVASYMLRYECGENPYEMRRETIMSYITEYSDIYVGDERKLIIEEKAKEIMKTGIKFKDACHVAAAIYAGCEYFISTDKRLLKYKTDEIRMVTPTEFVTETEGE